jgi:hypothetical protein
MLWVQRTAVSVNSYTVWDITPCRSVKVNRRFEERCLHLQGSRVSLASVCFMLVSCLACCLSPEDGGFFILRLPFIGSTIDHCRSRCKGRESPPLIHTYLSSDFTALYPHKMEHFITTSVRTSNPTNLQCSLLNIDTFYMLLSINIYQEFTNVLAFWELH